MENPTFVATARLDDETSSHLNLLRRRYFPSHRNFIDAHLTLFHALSPDAVTLLGRAAAETDRRAFEVVLPGPIPLGRGVAIRVESARLVSLRGDLARPLTDLSAQDRQPYRPHVTVQNKVTAEEASACLAELRRDWLPRVARVEGMDLWEYLGGPWQHHSRIDFPG
ncbi:2'-5' RNA ligase family protein [Tundrisphaera lichenicola]|uniref:2'-5' RNA ligase family protein n=1 Tax=Tundrisphaera lichenicola TaxID=2029860 RepID=UPI003EBBE49B